MRMTDRSMLALRVSSGIRLVVGILCSGILLSASPRGTRAVSLELSWAGDRKVDFDVLGFRIRAGNFVQGPRTIVEFPNYAVVLLLVLPSAFEVLIGARSTYLQAKRYRAAKCLHCG